MKKQLIESDYIGGQGSLTNEEELALRKYFTEKKKKLSTSITKKPSATKRKRPLTNG